MLQGFPYKVTLEKDKDYFYCTCGKSSTAPFCSGAHKGSDKSPKKFKAVKDGIASICGCNKSNNSPYCDGTHSK
jgi:CDGSH-type Zn-finger protein